MKSREFSNSRSFNTEAPKVNAKNRIEASRVAELITPEMLNKLEEFLADREKTPFSMESFRAHYLPRLQNVSAMRTLLNLLGGFSFGEQRAYGDTPGQKLKSATMIDKSVYEAGLSALRKKAAEREKASLAKELPKIAFKRPGVKLKTAETASGGSLQFIMNEQDKEQTLALKGATVLVGRSLRGRKVAAGDKISLVGDMGNYSVVVTGVSNLNAKADRADIEVKLLKTP